MLYIADEAKISKCENIENLIIDFYQQIYY